MPRKQITYSSNPNRRARNIHAQGERQFKSYDTSSIRPKKQTIPAPAGIAIIVIAMALLVFGLSSIVKECTAPKVDGSQVVIQSDTIVTIPEGSSAADIAELLESMGVIPDKKVFLTRATEMGRDSSFQAGTYTFTAGMTLDDIIGKLSGSGAPSKTLTIPEGYTVEKIAEAVEEVTNGSITATTFINQAKASRFANTYAFLKDVEDDSLEGFLFPKTYETAALETADDYIKIMLDQYVLETSSIDYTYARDHNLSEYDVLILASIIEREAYPTQDYPNERELVSSVFYNRMHEGMPLQSDATMMYVTKGEVTAEDLEQESPYNTYKNMGLTPTPICNPSLESIQAACNPAQTDYLYFFIIDNENYVDHTFSETINEHNAAIERANSAGA